MRFVPFSTAATIGLIACGVLKLQPFDASSDPAQTPQSFRHNASLTLPPTRSGEQTLAEAEETMRQKIDLLEQGREMLTSIDCYTVKIRKQEVVAGRLLDEQTIRLKCRRAPFSVYLIWLSGETGREVIYVDGRNQGRLIAHDGGWKARIPAISVDPESSLAMRDARYPVTAAGLLGLIDTMLPIHRADLSLSNLASCEVDRDGSFDGRPCLIFTTRYKSPEGSPTYRKSVTYIDREWKVPVHSRHYQWPSSDTALTESELDQSTLIESYSFTEIELHSGLTDRDFDRNNPDYNFH